MMVDEPEEELEPRFRIYGLRPYLRKDGHAIWGGHGWQVSGEFETRLSEVLWMVIDLSLRSAEARGKRYLRAMDLDRVDTALRVVAEIDRGMPGSRGVNVAASPPALQTRVLDPRVKRSKR